MFRKLAARWWRTTVCLLLCSAAMGNVLAQGWQGGAPEESWATPSVAAIKSAGPVSGLGQYEDLHHVNYDCTPESYRYEWELFGTSHNGCFAGSAFGDLDIDHYVIRGGSSQAIPLKAFANQGIVPIPGSAGIATTSPAAPMGSYLHIYTYLPSQVQLQYDWLLHPYLQLPPSSNLVLSDPAGNPLPVNAQTVAYSNDGSWMVVESPWHSFLRINMATFDMVPFAPSYTTLAFDYAPHESQVAITDDGRYIAVQSNEFKNFRVYDLASCTGEVTADLKPLNCGSHDYQSYIGSQIPNLGRIQHVRFMNDGLISFHAQHSANQDVYELAPTEKITNLLDYLALGDSYSSGEGAFNYISGTDTTNDLCHQSVNSYPYLLAKDAFTTPGSHSVACSGAVINDIKNTDKDYKGQVKDGVGRNKRTNSDDILASFTPGYLAQHEFVQKYQPRVVTVGIGGNDIGFSDILKACVLPHAGNNTCYDSYEDRKEITDTIDHTYDSWFNLYKQLQSEAPDTAFYAVGYPHIAAPDGNCGINVHLNNDEVIFSEYLIDYLNSVIAKAAADTGLRYIDISHALDGHRLCEAGSASIAVNGLTAGNDVHHVLGNESYHPNALGHYLIEQAILHATHNFADPAPALPIAVAVAPAAGADTPLLQAPKAGRTVRTVIPGKIAADDVVVKGSSLTLSINGAPGIKPSGTYTIALYGSHTSLGTVTADGQGNLSASIIVPADTPGGEDTLDVSGVDIAGQPIDFTQPIYVAESGEDVDGDGLAGSADSCPATPNSKQDADQNGTDDACDALIGFPPVAATNNDSTADTEASAGPTGNPSSSTGSTEITTAIVSAPSSNPEIVAPDLRDQSAARTASAPLSSAAVPASGIVLGATASGGKSAASLHNYPSVAKDNLRTIYWLPWAVDAGLLGLLLLFLNLLFGRMDRRR